MTGRQIGIAEWLETLRGAAVDAEERTNAKARKAAPGAETSREAFRSAPLTDLEREVLDELERGDGTAEELGDRLRARSGLSAFGPQTMSGTLNRLLHKRRAYRPGAKRQGRSGVRAWVWAPRPPSSR